MEIESVSFETHLIYGDVIYKRIENKETGSFDWYLKDRLIKDDWTIKLLDFKLYSHKRTLHK